MNNNFDYKESLNGIKAILFDIYEDQEAKIGLEEKEDERNARVNRFIELKDVALMLIEDIENLYQGTSIGIKQLENPEIDEEEVESKIVDLVENNNDSIKDEENLHTSNNEDDEVKEESDENNINHDETNISNELKKYYLNCDFKNVNFAYVPKEIFEKIKGYHIEEEQNNEVEFNEDEETEIEQPKEYNFQKENDNKPKGIIVRSDQYMKLALSKHRQGSVIEDAKVFRIKEAKKRQIENQKKELEKAELKFNM